MSKTDAMGAWTYEWDDENRLKQALTDFQAKVWKK